MRLWHIICVSWEMENNIASLAEELEALDKELIPVDGLLLRPSQCYRFETDPLHLMFNTNCPDELKKRVESILHKHVPSHESGLP